MDAASAAEIEPAVPFYAAIGDEYTVFETAHRLRLPLLLKGPTGCGKTRFVSHMTARLRLPLFTVDRRSPHPAARANRRA